MNNNKNPDSNRERYSHNRKEQHNVYYDEASCITNANPKIRVCQDEKPKQFHNCQKDNDSNFNTQDNYKQVVK